HRPTPPDRSEAERAQFAAGARTFPDFVETAGELAAAGAGAMPGLAVETMAERTEVVAAGVAGDERGRPAAVHRILDLAHREHAGQALGQAQQRGLGALH